MSLSINLVIPNPDDATNGVQPGVSITITRVNAGVVVTVVNPGDPNGPWDASFATALPTGSDRTALRDLLLKILATFKTARGYV